MEARSVNGRGLEVRFRGPPGFDLLERAARDAGQARFQRGQLTVALQAKRAEAAGAVRVNQAQLNAYLELSATLVGEGRAALPTVDGLLALRGVLEVADDADDAETRSGIEAAMTASLASALERLSRLAANRADLVDPGHAVQIIGLLCLCRPRSALWRTLSSRRSIASG